MNTKPTLKGTDRIAIFIAATLASMVAIGLLAAVTQLFLRSGTPMEQLVVAERACIHHRYVSEREACMRQPPSSTRSPSMATR